MFARALLCYASPVSAVGFSLGTYICFALLVCSALPIVMVLWLLLTSCSSLLLRLLSSARPRGISRQTYLVYPLDLHTRVTVAFWVFDICCHLARRVCLHIQFLSVGPRFRYCFFSPAPHGTDLASRYGVRRQLRPCGLSPQTDGMPVIPKNRVLFTESTRPFCILPYRENQ